MHRAGTGLVFRTIISRMFCSPGFSRSGNASGDGNGLLTRPRNDAVCGANMRASVAALSAKADIIRKQG